jgi:hypothetical protein
MRGLARAARELRLGKPPPNQNIENNPMQSSNVVDASTDPAKTI